LRSADGSDLLDREQPTNKRSNGHDARLPIHPISTDEDRQPTLLGTQRERLERYCQAMENWHIAAAFEDQATDTTLERPGLKAALDLARQGRLELLLVYRVDRPQPQGAPARRLLRRARPALRRERTSFASSGWKITANASLCVR
jgi:Resolvase, N terminal domain